MCVCRHGVHGGVLHACFVHFCPCVFLCVYTRVHLGVLLRVTVGASIYVTHCLCLRLPPRREQCLGSIQHLKERFGSGYTAEFKLASATPDFVERTRGRIAQLLPGKATMTVAEATSLCASMGVESRAEQLTSNGTGWALVSAVQGTGLTPAMFADWWCEEDLSDAMVRFVCVTAFPGSKLTER